MPPETALNKETSSDHSEGKNADLVITCPSTALASQTSFTIGDQVVLVGEGVAKAKKIELAMTWTVKKAGSKWIQVINEHLGDRQFPANWLKVLKPAAVRVFNG